MVRVQLTAVIAVFIKKMLILAKIAVINISIIGNDIDWEKLDFNF